MLMVRSEGEYTQFGEFMGDETIRSTVLEDLAVTTSIFVIARSGSVTRVSGSRIRAKGPLWANPAGASKVIGG
jgi:hypothetical protein